MWCEGGAVEKCKQGSKKGVVALKKSIALIVFTQEAVGLVYFFGVLNFSLSDGWTGHKEEENDDVDSKAGIQFVGWFDIQHFGGGGYTVWTSCYFVTAPFFEK